MKKCPTQKILMELCQAELRCLDAHWHLGNFVFDHHPQNAIRNHEDGLRIGELSLGDEFTGVLAWGLIDNRPFLRCMHGYGLCLWRLGRFDEAERIRMTRGEIWGAGKYKEKDGNIIENLPDGRSRVR